MLKEAKLAMGIDTKACDGEIADLLDAGARDLQIAGVVIPGTVAFTVTENGVRDDSTLTDRLVMRAIITYARMIFRSPADFDRLERIYKTLKGNLTHSTGYTRWSGEEDSSPAAQNDTGAAAENSDADPENTGAEQSDTGSEADGGGNDGQG